MFKIKYIILDTSEELRLSRLETQCLKEWVADEDSILSLLFNLLYSEENALLNIEYECLSLINDSKNKIWIKDIEIIVREILKLGNYLYKELQRLNIYSNGILNYKFDQTICADIVIVRKYGPYS